MPLDPLLANPTPFKFANPLEDYTNFLQAQHLQTEIQKAKRAEEDDAATNNSFKKAYSQPGLDEMGKRNALLSDLAANNRGKLIPGFQKQFAETDKASAESGKFLADTSKANVEATAKELDNLKSTYLDGLTYDPSLDQHKMFGFFKAMANNPVTSKWIQSNNQSLDDYLKQNVGEMMVARNNPDAWKQFAQMHQMGATKAAEAIQQAAQLKLQASKKNLTHVNLGDHQALVQHNEYGDANPQVVMDLKGGPKVPQTTVNVNNLPENKAAGMLAETVAKGFGGNLVDLSKSANSAAKNIADLDQIKALVSGGALTGAAGPAQARLMSYLESAGFKFSNDPVARTQELNKALAKNVLNSVGALHAAGISRLTNMDMSILQDASGSGNLDANALLNIIEKQKKDHQYSVARYNTARQQFANSQDPHIRAMMQTMAPNDIEIPGLDPAMIARLKQHPERAAGFDKAVGIPGAAASILGTGGTSTGGAPFNGLAPPAGGGGGLAPVAPGFTPTPYGKPNPMGGMGPLGRPASMPAHATAATDALRADILKHYPGANIFSEYRSPEDQAAIYARAQALHGADARAWAAPPGGSSHNWGTALDVSVGPAMWEQFKADMRRRGLRAYDETGHIHVDDRTDLPNGPGERRRK